MVVCFAVILVAGCGGSGGGGSLSKLSDAGDTIDEFVDPGDGGGDDPIVPVANPEPSSMMLLGSGLLGMAVYAKTRLKFKNKK